MNVDAPDISKTTLFVILCDEDIFLALSEKDEDVTKIKNPLSAYFTQRAILAAYKKSPVETTALLNKRITAAATDLLKKRDLSQAEEIVVAGKNVYQKILLGLPSDCQQLPERITETVLPAKSVRLLPALNETIGAEVVAECVKLKEKSLLVDCERTVAFYLIGEKDDLATAIWDCAYDEIGLRCIRAAAKYLCHEEKFSAVYLFGKHLREAEDALDEDFACIRKEKSVASVIDAFTTPRTFSNLKKELARTTYIRVYDKEVFQRYLTE